MACARSTGAQLSLKGAPADLSEPKACLADGVFFLPGRPQVGRASLGILTCGKTSSSVTIQKPTPPLSKLLPQPQIALHGASPEQRRYQFPRNVVLLTQCEGRSGSNALARHPTFCTSAEAISRRRFSLAVHYRILT